MNRYVDVEKVQRLIIEMCGRHSRNGEDIQTCSSICVDLVTSVYKLSTVDVVEVRHGRWVKHLVPTDFDGEVFNVEHIVCSVCEAAIPLNSTYKTKWYSDYCPSCGAKMEGEEE